MKFEQEKKFQPIVITLETKGEAQALIDILGDVTGSQGDSLAYKLYLNIQEAGFNYNPDAYSGSRKSLISEDD